MINHDFGKLILRVCVGGLMLFHGIFKLQYGIDGVTGLLESRGLPTFMAYGVYVGEILAPLLILIGYQVRLAALVEIFTMLIAIYSVFGFSIFGLNNTGGWVIEHQLLYILPCLALFFMGGGRYGIHIFLKKSY